MTSPMHTYSLRPILVFSLAIVHCICLPQSIFAQENVPDTQTHPTITPLPEQLELSNEAVTALNQYPPNAKLAIEKIDQALRLGPGTDLFYMTLGRAYQYEDQCQGANETFSLAEKAPSVEGIPHDVVMKKILRYKDEAAELCSGTLVLECSDLTVKFQTGEKEFLCNQPILLKPGNHDIKTTKNGQVVSTFSTPIKGLQTNKIVVGKDLRISELEKDLSTGAKLARPVLFTGVGLTAVGAGLTTFGFVTASQLNSDLENQNLTFTEAEDARMKRRNLYISGGALLGVGTAAIITGIILNKKRKQEEGGQYTFFIQPEFSPSNASASLLFTVGF